MDAHTLHIGINAQLVSFAQTYRNAGVSRYTLTLLAALANLDPAETCQRYTAWVSAAEAPVARDGALGAPDRLRIAASRWPTAWPPQRVLWEQLVLPTLLRSQDSAVFHSPVNVLPVWVPCPSVVTIHDLAFVRYPKHLSSARRLYQQLFTAYSARAAARVVAVSESTRRDLCTHYRIPQERVRVIYPAIDLDFQPPYDPTALAAFRAGHGLPERYLLFLGTLEPRKNLLLLLEAYSRLRALHPAAPPLVLAGGKGWYYQALFERVRVLGLQRQVLFSGYVQRAEQPLWYAASELFVYPSLYEGFGLPVVEALACGTPTITSNVSSLPEAAGAVAIQVDPSDREALAQAMHGALADGALRPRTLVAGPRWARGFSSDRMARAYVDVYNEAAGSRHAFWRRRGR